MSKESNGLDLDNEFVRAVHDYQCGRTSLDQSVVLLGQIEAEHDLQLVAPGLEYSYSTEGIEVSEDARFGQLLDPSEELLNELVQNKLFPFLSDSHAVLLPSYPDDSDVVFSGRYFYHGTARAIASCYAAWANNANWLGRASWHYTDLYYSQTLPDDVFQWIQALFQVVEAKCSIS